MGKLVSKLKGDSPGHPWSSSSVPSGSWIIRFLTIEHTEKFINVKDIKGLPLFCWSCPDWITDELFNKLMSMVVQLFLEREYNRISKLMVNPLEAVELIDQFNTFIEFTKQDITELQNQLLEAAHQSIYLHVENEELKYLDLLVSNDFDPDYELRAILCKRKKDSISSKSSSSDVSGSELSDPHQCNKVNRISDDDPLLIYPSNTCKVPVVCAPLEPSAPIELNEGSETETKSGYVNTGDKPCFLSNSDVVMQNKQSFDIDTFTNQKDSAIESENVNNPSGSRHANSGDHNGENRIVYVDVPSGSIEHSDNDGPECGDVSAGATHTDAHGHSNNDGAVCRDVFVGPRNADSSEQSDNSVPFCGTYSLYNPSGTSDTDASEHIDNDLPVCGDVCTGAVHTDASEHSDKDVPVCGDVSTGAVHTDASEHSDNDVPVCGDVSTGAVHTDASEHSDNDVPVCADVSTGAVHTDASEHSNDDVPVCGDVSTGAVHTDASEHSDNNVPIFGDVSTGAAHTDASEHSDNDGAVCDVASPNTRHADSVRNISDPCSFLPIYGLSRNSLSSSPDPVKRKTEDIKKEKSKEEGTTEQRSKLEMPSSSGLIFPPFHGLSHSLFGRPRKYTQESSIGTESQKRRANDDSFSLGISAKKVRLDENENAEVKCIAEENELCHSNNIVTEIQDQNQTWQSASESVEHDSDNDSNSSENLEWHDAMEDTDKQKQESD